MKKAQVSIEYMFAVGTLLLVFALIMFIAEFNERKNDNFEKIINARETCLLVSNAITQLHFLGEGSTKTISFPNYNITIGNNGTIDVYSYSEFVNLNTNEYLYNCNYFGIFASTEEAVITLTLSNREGVIHVGAG